MKTIESDIIKAAKYDRIQNFEGNKEKIKNEISDSLLSKIADGLVMLVTDENIVCDTTKDGYWDEYQFKAYILTQNEYEKLTNKKSFSNLHIGAEINDEKINNIIEKVKILNQELERLSSNTILGNINNITINTSAFMGSEQDAREFAELMSKYINEESECK